MAECNRKENCICKRLTEFESKITPAADIHLIDALLDNWLKNNPYYFRL